MGLDLVQQRAQMLVLTQAGRELAEAAGRLTDGGPEEAAARRSYDAFLPLNVRLLEVCAAWQMQPGDVPNNHTDAAYDWDVREQLDVVHARVVPQLHELGAVVPRFARYPSALDAALARLDEGDDAWFTSPRVDSYHTVWMQLHEEFRLALGISAAAEAAAED
jgi:hypothetical protein